MKTSMRSYQFSLEKFNTMATRRTLTRQNQNDQTRLSFAYENLETFTDRLASIDPSKIEHLDLTENRLTDLRFLIDFVNLQTLIVDKNRCTCHVKIPLLPRLQTLCINENEIRNLVIFLKTLNKSCPELKYLSMMKNPAAPSFFNGGSYQEYVEYRYFVISQLKNLTMLDDRAIPEEERKKAAEIFPPISLVVREKKLSRTNSSSSPLA